MCAIDDADASDLYHEQDRTARTRHRCADCRRTIRPGELARQVKDLWHAIQRAWSR
jgi:hypothetical protein